MRTNLADSPEWNAEDHAFSQGACWGREARHTVQVLVQGLPEWQGQHVATANVRRNVSVLLEDVTLLQDLGGRDCWWGALRVSPVLMGWGSCRLPGRTNHFLKPNEVNGGGEAAGEMAAGPHVEQRPRCLRAGLETDNAAVSPCRASAECQRESCALHP